MEGVHEGERRSRRLRLRRVVREGVISGATGAAAVVLAHGIVDVLAGDPLRTPSTLYSVALQGEAVTTEVQVLVFSAIHIALWLAVGMLAALLVGVADLYPRTWSKIAAAGAFVFFSVLYISGVLSTSAQSGLPLWLGTFVGSAALAAALAARHGGVLRVQERLSLTETGLRNLEASHAGECRLRDFYRAAASRHPGDATLDDLLARAERNVQRLENLFRHYRRPIPAGSGQVLGLPDAPGDLYRVALLEEEAKVERYDRFLIALDERALRETLRHLRSEAHDEILPMLRTGADL